MELKKFTKNMMVMLPQWMKMAKDPESVGAKFLDAFSVEYGEVERYLEECLNNQFIGTANLGMIDFAYKVPLALGKVLDFNENVSLDVVLYKDNMKASAFQVYSLKHFYESDEACFIVDRQEEYIYIRLNDLMMDDVFNPLDAISIDGTLHYEYHLHHIWNAFDEFGILLGLNRLPGERNPAFKERILDVFKNPANSTKEGVLNGIARELGIKKEDMEVNSLVDKSFIQKIMNEDGTPKKRFMDYVDAINHSLGFTWDNMNWGEAYWRSIEESKVGFYYLPHIWDGFSPTWKDHEIQSGIGSGDDLLVHKPQSEESTRKFKAYVGLRGTVPNAESLYPELKFKYKITAKGKVPNKEYKMEDYKYTVVTSEIIKLSYLLTATKQFLYQTRLNWIENTYMFEDQSNPGMDIVTGEDVLHKATDPYVKVLVEMASIDRKYSPSLEELNIVWEDDAGALNTYTMTTPDDWTQHGGVVDTEFKDTFATETGEVELGFGDFYAVVDTEGAFMQGERDLSVVILKDGSITLDIKG